VNDPILPPLRTTFRAVAQSIVPEAARLDESGWMELERTVEDALLLRPPAMRRQLATFIKLLHWLPVTRFGRPLTSLSAAERERFLSSIQSAPVLLLRRGFWGLRTLVYMGFYTRQAVAAEIGYAATSRGWEARR
jgi:hypothetical protein